MEKNLSRDDISVTICRSASRKIYPAHGAKPKRGNRGTPGCSGYLCKIVTCRSTIWKAEYAAQTLPEKSGPGIKSRKILLKALLIGQIKRYSNGTEGKPDQETRRLDQ